VALWAGISRGIRMEVLLRREELGGRGSEGPRLDSGLTGARNIAIQVCMFNGRLRKVDPQ